MRRLLAFITLSSLALAPTAHAAAVSSPGVNLRWDRCYGDGGVQYRDFACDTNTGSERLVGSFELASAMPGVSGIEMYLNLGTSSAALPAWWTFNSSGGVTGCRGNALSASLTPPATAISCVDWAQGGAAGGIIFKFGFPDVQHARIIGSSALSAPLDVPAGQEWFAFSINLTHAKTVGTGACAGCLDPVAIVLAAIRLVPAQGSSVTLTNGANYSGSTWVSWQMGYPINIRHGCESSLGGFGCYNPTAYFDVVPYDVTGTRGTTWGQLKSLYR